MRIKYIIYSVLFALLLGSCSKEDIEIKGPAKRTVLAYMIASTNLGSDIRANIRQMMTVASTKHSTEEIWLYIIRKAKADLI